MGLTDTAIKQAKPSDKVRRLYDEKGLYLEISPKGGKWFRFKYRFEGKEKRLSLGTYPEVSLKEARSRRDDMRQQVANGIDPAIQRKTLKASKIERDQNTFEAITREWFAKNELNWKPSHSSKIIRRFERDIFPYLGNRPVKDIEPPELLRVIQKIEKRGAIETAHRAMQNCGQVFRYAVATGRAGRDPTNDLRGALAPTKGNHFAAVTEPDEVAILLRVIDGYDGTPIVCAALKLAPLVFVRPGELRNAKWVDIDFENAEWRFQASKTDSKHIVPLANQAVAILEGIRPLTQHSEYVFPSARSPRRPMSENAILAAFRRMEIPKEKMSGHGFRAMARTILDEVLEFPIHIIEQQLAHAVKDMHGRAYNRTKHLEQRREMMQKWANYLEALEKPFINL
ncbi:MAG: integrase [Rhodomicrobium sp.]|nr:MAG: integrase [Rhodomicrobium sp.]